MKIEFYRKKTGKAVKGRYVVDKDGDVSELNGNSFGGADVIEADDIGWRTTQNEALQKENEQLKYMVGLDKNDPIPEWEMIEPTFWKGVNLTVIGDRHLPNGRRQHLVKETSGELREFGNADIFYSEGVK